MLISGSCLCKAVRYEIKGRLQDAGNCHCKMCRKAHGAAFASNADVEPADFRWVSGEDSLSSYESSPGQSRIFCSVCGSKLAFSEKGRVVMITLGTVDGDPGIRPRSHIFVAWKAEWHQIDDDLPRFDEWPPGDGWL